MLVFLMSLSICCRDLGGFPYNGIKNLYAGGGYAVTLGNTPHSSRKKLETLKNQNWIDRHTAALFVEFTVSITVKAYCRQSQINSFSVLTL